VAKVLKTKTAKNLPTGLITQFPRDESKNTQIIDQIWTKRLTLIAYTARIHQDWLIFEEKQANSMGGHATIEITPPARKGTETEEELRALIIQLTMSSVWHPTDNRVIRMLAGLSFASLINLVNGMSREVCLEVLAGENASKAILQCSLGRTVPSATANPAFPGSSDELNP
jgi:hypothetical protein